MGFLRVWLAWLGEGDFPTICQDCNEPHKVTTSLSLALGNKQRPYDPACFVATDEDAGGKTIIKPSFLCFQVQMFDVKE